jgi:hypothetical protein
MASASRVRVAVCAPGVVWLHVQVEKDVPLTAEELETQETERAEKAAAKAKKDDEDVSDEGGPLFHREHICLVWLPGLQSTGGSARRGCDHMCATLGTDEEAEKEEEAPTTKKITVTEHDWEQLNTQNAIWLRNPADVTPEEYEKFYKAISKASASARPCCTSTVHNAVRTWCSIAGAC